MSIKNICLIILIISPLNILAQNQSDSVQITKLLNQVNVNALRAGDKTPVAFTNISKLEIEKLVNFMICYCMLLWDKNSFHLSNQCGSVRANFWQKSLIACFLLELFIQLSGSPR